MSAPSPIQTTPRFPPSAFLGAHTFSCIMARGWRGRGGRDEGGEIKVGSLGVGTDENSLPQYSPGSQREASGTGRWQPWTESLGRFNGQKIHPGEEEVEEGRVFLPLQTRNITGNEGEQHRHLKTSQLL